MIEGFVNANYEPVVSLPLRGPAGQAREVEAVIDTGFNGYLTLPTALVSELGLPFRTRGAATLANGSEETFGVYGVTMLWDDHSRYVDADAVGPTPLIGMMLLDAHSLYLEVADGGRVVIQPVE